MSSDAGTIATWYVDPDAENAMADGHAPIWRHLIGLVPEQDLSTRTVLDFGCNQGGFLRHLHALRPFRKALGIDI
ncbi:SAM-dependent methyltransferase, partial [Escherichia coli]